MLLDCAGAERLQCRAKEPERVLRRLATEEARADGVVSFLSGREAAEPEAREGGRRTWTTEKFRN
jgi:hypothetical protein